MDLNSDAVRPWLRDGARRDFNSALDWIVSRLRTQEEALLISPLLLLLAPLNAVVAPRRLNDGEFGGLRVSVSRVAIDHIERRSWSISILEGDTGKGDSEGEAVIRIGREEVLTAPWATAARIIGTVLGVIVTAIDAGDRITTSVDEFALLEN